RYILGELTGDDRDRFEEHFFECPECTEDVRALTVFQANARAVFREEAATPALPAVPARALLGNRILWCSAVLNCLLLVGLGIALLKFGPEAQRELAEARAPQFVQEVPVLGVARGDGSPWQITSSTQRVVFSFYLWQPFRNIAYEVKDASGTVVPRGVLPA